MLLNFVDGDVRKIFIVSILGLPPRAVGVNVYRDALERAELERIGADFATNLTSYMERN